MPVLDLWPGQLQRTTHFDVELAQLADRHYPERKRGSPQFTSNGRKLVLRDAAGDVLWVWMWQEHRWDGQEGYYCARFRNESPRLSSDVILEAERHAAGLWGPGRMFTYVNPAAVRSTNPGYCFLVAGWHSHGYSAKRGYRLLVKGDDCDVPVWA